MAVCLKRPMVLVIVLWNVALVFVVLYVAKGINIRDDLNHALKGGSYYVCIRSMMMQRGQSSHKNVLFI